MAAKRGPGSPPTSLGSQLGAPPTAAKKRSTVLDELLAALTNLTQNDKLVLLSRLELPDHQKLVNQTAVIKLLLQILNLPIDEINNLLTNTGKTVHSTKINDLDFEFIFSGILSGYQIVFCRSINSVGKIQPIILYKSGSQGVWRLALSGTLGLRMIFDKLSDYTSTTLIDFRLQKFIEETYANIYVLPLSDNISYGFLFNYVIYTGGNIDTYINWYKSCNKALLWLFHYLNTTFPQIDSRAIHFAFNELGYIPNNLLIPLTNAINQIQDQTLQKRIYKDVITPVLNMETQINNTKNIVKTLLDTPRLYNGIGTEIFKFVSEINHMYFSKPCNKKLLETLIQLCDKYITNSNNTCISTDIWAEIKHFIGSKLPNHDPPNNEKQCLIDLLEIINKILEDIFIYEEPVNPEDIFSTKLENKNFPVTRNSTFQNSPCRLVTHTKTLPRRKSTNNTDRSQYTHQSQKVKLLDTELSVTTLVVKIKETAINIKLKPSDQQKIKDAKFLFYYGKYVLCGKIYNIPLCLVPCDAAGTQLKINKFGLPSQYISIGMYIGKTYDYQNQVCILYDEPVKHVKISRGYEYVFCGNFYDDIWPFKLMKHRSAPMQVTHSPVVTGGKLFSKYNKTKRNKLINKRKHTLKLTEK